MYICAESFLEATLDSSCSYSAKGFDWEWVVSSSQTLDINEGHLVTSYICQGVGPLVRPFRSYVTRSLFEGLIWSFCQLGSSVPLPCVIYFEVYYLHVVSSFSFIPVIVLKLVLFLTLCNLRISFVIYPSVSCCSSHVVEHGG